MKETYIVKKSVILCFKCIKEYELETERLFLLIYWYQTGYVRKWGIPYSLLENGVYPILILERIIHT